MEDVPTITSGALGLLVFFGIVMVAAVVGAVYLGTDPATDDDDDEWHEFLTTHPDAIGLLEADHAVRVEQARRDHTEVPPPVPR